MAVLTFLSFSRQASCSCNRWSVSMRFLILFACSKLVDFWYALFKEMLGVVDGSTLCLDLGQAPPMFFVSAASYLLDDRCRVAGSLHSRTF